MTLGVSGSDDLSSARGGVVCFDPKKLLDLDVSALDPKSPPELPSVVGGPKIDVPGAGEVTEPNLGGAGVVVGVVDSWLDVVGKRDDCGLACGVCSVDSMTSISSSLTGGVFAVDCS